MTTPTPPRRPWTPRSARLARRGALVVGLVGLLAGPGLAQDATAPTDAIAGNPNSLQSKMVDADMIAASSGPYVARDAETGRFETVDNWLRTEADFSYFNARGTRGESYDVDLGFGVNLPARRLALIFDVPFALTKADHEGLAYLVSGGVGLQVRLRDNWNVTPMFRVGYGGSVDDGELGLLYSGSIVSTAKWRLKGYDVEMSNLFGIESSVDRVHDGSAPGGYDMLAGLFQNGIAIGKPMRTRLLGKRIHWNAFYRLTNIVGEDVFLANQQAAGLRYETGGHADGMTLEVGWAGGADYDSLRVRFLGRF